MKIFDKEINSLFKKELTSEEKLKLSQELLQVNISVNSMLNFIKDYGAYKTRSRYKLSDVEYLEKIKQIILNTQNMTTKLIVAEKIIEVNGLNDIYSKTATHIFNYINNLMAQAAKKQTQIKKEQTDGKN